MPALPIPTQGLINLGAIASTVTAGVSFLGGTFFSILGGALAGRGVGDKTGVGVMPLQEDQDTYEAWWWVGNKLPTREVYWQKLRNAAGEPIDLVTGKVIPPPDKHWISRAGHRIGTNAWAARIALGVVDGCATGVTWPMAPQFGFGDRLTDENGVPQAQVCADPMPEGLRGGPRWPWRLGPVRGDKRSFGPQIFWSKSDVAEAEKRGIHPSRLPWTPYHARYRNSRGGAASPLRGGDFTTEDGRPIFIEGRGDFASYWIDTRAKEGHPLFGRVAADVPTVIPDPIDQAWPKNERANATFRSTAPAPFVVEPNVMAEPEDVPTFAEQFQLLQLLVWADRSPPSSARAWVRGQFERAIAA